MEPLLTSRDRAYLLASLSELAYNTAEKTSQYFRELPWQFDEDNYFDIPSTDTQAFIVYSQDTGDIVLAFRGTSLSYTNRIDLWMDIWSATAMSYPNHITAKVGSGFYYAWESVKSTIIQKLREVIIHVGSSSKVNITGHSLGGALAIFATVDILKELYLAPTGPVPVFLETFGSPPVGDLAFKYYFNQVADGIITYNHYLLQDDEVIKAAIAFLTSTRWSTPFSDLPRRPLPPGGGHPIKNYMQQLRTDRGYIPRQVKQAKYRMHPEDLLISGNDTVQHLMIRIFTSTNQFCNTADPVEFSVLGFDGSILFAYSFGSSVEHEIPFLGGYDTFVISSVNAKLLVMNLYKCLITKAPNTFNQPWKIDQIQVFANGVEVISEIDDVATLDNQNPRRYFGIPVAVFEITGFIEEGSKYENHPELTLTIPPSYKILSGGALVSVKKNGQGNLLTESYPKDINNWKAKAKDHIKPSTATLSISVIALYDPLDEWDVIITQQKGPEAQHPSASVALDHSYTLTGGGARDAYTGEGNMLVASYPKLEAGIYKWEAAGADDLVPDATGTVTSYIIGIKKKDQANLTVSPVAIFSKAGEESGAPWSTSVPDWGFVFVGGGAMDEQRSYGNFLMGSWPINGDTWEASGRDHLKADYEKMTAYSIGMIGPVFNPFQRMAGREQI